MTEIVFQSDWLHMIAAETPAPILSDERLEYLANHYQKDKWLQSMAHFDLFASFPDTYFGGVRPVENAPPEQGTEYRRLLPKQRLAAAIIDRPFLLEWLGRRKGEVIPAHTVTPEIGLIEAVNLLAAAVGIRFRKVDAQPERAIYQRIPGEEREPEL